MCRSEGSWLLWVGLGWLCSTCVSSSWASGPAWACSSQGGGKAQNPGRFLQTCLRLRLRMGAFTFFLSREHIRFVPLLGPWHCCQPGEHCPQTPVSHMSQLRSSLDGPSAPPSPEQPLLLGHCFLESHVLLF